MLRERRCEQGHSRVTVMGLLEVIFPEIRQPIRFSELDTIGPHCSRMRMTMLESVISARDVGEGNPNQQDH